MILFPVKSFTARVYYIIFTAFSLHSYEAYINLKIKFLVLSWGVNIIYTKREIWWTTPVGGDNVINKILSKYDRIKGIIE